jgi:chromosome segregation ATPase
LQAQLQLKQTQIETLEAEIGTLKLQVVPPAPSGEIDALRTQITEHETARAQQTEQIESFKRKNAQLVKRVRELTESLKEAKEKAERDSQERTDADAKVIEANARAQSLEEQLAEKTKVRASVGSEPQGSVDNGLFSFRFQRNSLRAVSVRSRHQKCELLEKTARRFAIH